MITGTAKLVIDLGNSETRIQVMHGKSKGKVRRSFANFSNSYAEHDPSIVPQSTFAKKSFQFTSQGEVEVNDGGKTIINESKREYVGGAVVPREYDNRRIEPRATYKKYQSLSTLLAFHIAFFKGIELVADMNHVTSDEVDVEWEVSVLLPPGDIALGSEGIAKILRSINRISFTLPYTLEKDIVIAEGGISVRGEGHSAFVGVLFEDSTKVREEYIHLSKERVLVIDIGAGTTDFLVISEGHVIEDTKFTTNTGGNNVSQTLRSTLRKGGASYTLSSVKRAVTEGGIPDGATVVDVRPELADAKRQVSFTLINALQDFFDETGFNPRSINHLLVVGGGSIRSKIEGIEPISTYLIDEMKKFSPNIGLVSIPTTTVNNRNGEGVVTELNPRLLNIIGAGIQMEG